MYRMYPENEKGKDNITDKIVKLLILDTLGWVTPLVSVISGSFELFEVAIFSVLNKKRWILLLSTVTTWWHSFHVYPSAFREMCPSCDVISYRMSCK